MVPWATNRVADHEPLGKGTPIVAASPANREDLGAPSNDDDRLPIDVSKEGDAVLERPRGDASR
jgi:hypothetical protein